MEAALIKDQVREFITKIATRRGVKSISDDDSLTSAGVLYSMGISVLSPSLKSLSPSRSATKKSLPIIFHSINTIQEFVSAKMPRDDDATVGSV